MNRVPVAGRAGTDSPDARARIAMAGIRCIVRGGIPEVSMAEIAQEAGVSKALLHYHFADRAHLIAGIVGILGRRLVDRERAAMMGGGDGGPVDVLWRWVDAELRRGELHALLTADANGDTPIAAALEKVSHLRREAAQRTVAGVFERLGLTVRVPMHVIADTHLVFMDGLALRRRDVEEARLRFDVFWLALLGLGG